MAIEISSDTQININQHFRVSAGPGAGKTHWLSNHVAHVLKDTDRLGKMGKVACLSYTNVGADTLMGRLFDSRNRVVSSTIHSFLYSHIVKPYLNFIAAEEGFNIKLLKGEDDRILSDYQTIDKVLTNAGQRYADHNMVVSAIKKAKWRIDNGILVCRPDSPQKCTRQSTKLKNQAYESYKRLAWENGYMHYDDVLYFSYKLIHKYPLISEILVKQFPYVFVDEFQDSNPIQVAIIKMLGKNGAIVGIIGDEAQSIYGFLGADPNQFRSFALEGLQDYYIPNNRRSRNEIIDLLNIVRPEFHQSYVRNEHGMKPLLLIGKVIPCYDVAKKISGSEVYALSYQNIEANILKQRANIPYNNRSLLDNIDDSNYDRKQFVTTWIKAIEHARSKQYWEAFKMLEKVGVIDMIAYDALKDALDNYDKYCDGNLVDFVGHLRRYGNISKILPNTKIHDFYSTHTYRDLSQCVGLVRDTSAQRTVHKAKGDEFDNVFVVFKEEYALNLLLNPNMNNEQNRVYYVAMSRARDRLFLTVPSLTPQMDKNLRKLPININYV